MFPFAPTHRIRSVTELTPDRLERLGIASLLIDVDCTLKRYAANEPAPGAGEWLKEIEAAGVGICLVSNGRGERIARFAEVVDLPYEALAIKPLPFGLRRACRRMEFDKKVTAMVGDQLFTDMPAGRFAGVQTILVEPIHPEDEPWFARIKRGVERWILARMKPPIVWDGQ